MTANRPVFLLTLLLAAGGATAAPPDASVERPNIVLITIEATRFDHLGCYYDVTAKTPTIDTLAREGALAEQAVSTSPLTLVSHASIMTGLYPPRHGVRDNAGFTLSSTRSTLAQTLKSQGYATVGAVGSALLGTGGLRRGFDSFDFPKVGSRGGKGVVDDALAAIKKLKPGPLFLWIQLDDAHEPYLPPTPFDKDYANRPYDGEIAFMDTQIRRVIDDPRIHPRLDNTIVVIAGAQGESLGEHGEETHGLLVYDTTIHVPLIVHFPRKIEGDNHRSKDVISLADVAPTILDFAGLPPLAGIDGKSAAAALTGSEAGLRGPVYAESLYGERTFGWAPLHVWRTGKLKFIDSGEVYDVIRDPSETIDLAAKDKSVAAPYRTQLRDLRRAIGDSGPDTPSTKRDPKTGVAASNFYMKAQTRVEAGRPDEAPAFLDKALARDPENKAVKALMAAIQGKPVEPTGAAANTFAAQWNLGNAKYLEGKLDESAAAFRKALELNPGSADTHYALASVLLAQGDQKTAEAELRSAVAKDPKMAEAWNKLGIIQDKTGRRPEALESFAKALSAEPDFADSLFNRAKIEMQEKKLADSRRDLDHLLHAHPGYTAGMLLNAHLCTAENDPEGAKAALTKLIAKPNVDPKMKAAAQEMLQKLGG